MRLTLLLLVLALTCPVTAPAQGGEMEVILLGTGFPRPHPERAGPATAVVVRDKWFIVDAGRGVMMRLAKLRPPTPNVRAVLLTHLHSDHISGLPDLFTTTWIFGRETPLELYGPQGTRRAADGVLELFHADIPIRRDKTEMNAPAGATFKVHEIEEGVIYKDADVTITAFAVDHRPVSPALGYRFDAGGKSVVISGDTRPSENLVRHAKGVDFLVHEVYLPEFFDRGDHPDVAARLKAYHTSAEQVGEVAARAGVKTLVLTHLIPADGGEEFVRRASRRFKGKIVVGEDLLRF